VDPRDLPLNAAVEALEVIVRPARRTGVRVEFPISEANGLLVRLADSLGTPVPMGATVTIDGGYDQFPVALRGAVYLTGLEPGTVTLRVKLPEGTCVARLRIEVEDLRAGGEAAAVCEKESHRQL
jgi:outer membrane usher protein